MVRRDEIISLQAACFADDVPFDEEELSQWTREEVVAFFESGGTELPRTHLPTRDCSLEASLQTLLTPLLRLSDLISLVGRYGPSSQLGAQLQPLTEQIDAELSRLHELPNVGWDAIELDGYSLKQRLCYAAEQVRLAAMSLLRGETDHDAFVKSMLCHEALYPSWRILPAVSRHFLASAAQDNPRVLERLAAASQRPPGDDGIFHFRNEWGERGGYSVYVPEARDASQPLALVMALHGATGHGRAMLLSWMKACRARADVLLVAPTSRHESTWSLVPEKMEDDFPRLLEIVGAVERRWGPLAHRRFLLTGMSDGGTYTWLCGLRERSVFTHLAPFCPGPAFGFPAIAALLKISEETRTTLSQKPVYMVSGTHDHLFDIATSRKVATALTRAGAQLTFCEKTDMGHTQPREELPVVLDWLLGT
ncbi:hypothetical protein AB1Y20_015105 [Prymnesium parvum]|uniref:Phospholipase/carboxylesterase/thioesterase domain-containing protein n=1 Tax=Prymnesium parvum TaxID=97485 RepID=A0AB34JZK8_PRYPA